VAYPYRFQGFLPQPHDSRAWGRITPSETTYSQLDIETADSGTDGPLLSPFESLHGAEPENYVDPGNRLFMIDRAKPGVD
jgi:hypothetical protein